MTIIDPQVKKKLCNAQQDEINSYHIYMKLSKKIKNPHNADILTRIAEDEKEHYETLKQLTECEFRPNTIKVWIYIFILRVFGLTFGMQLMERGEEEAQVLYAQLTDRVPQMNKILNDEEIHENALIEVLDEELLNYVSSIVLGLSDALVELTGVLAGFTLALNNGPVIAVIGLITGISASLSMGASEFLATSEEEPTEHKSPLKAALYTGSAYLGTVILLVFPYFLIEPIFALAITLIIAILIIFIFTFYVSIAKSLPFKSRFLRISTISLGVAVISLFIGLVVKAVFNIDI